MLLMGGYGRLFALRRELIALLEGDEKMTDDEIVAAVLAMKTRAADALSRLCEAREWLTEYEENCTCGAVDDCAIEGAERG